MDQFQNPFKLKHIRSLTNQADDFDVFGPSVVMASPGFLQSGVRMYECGWLLVNRVNCLTNVISHSAIAVLSTIFF